jgi:hypothetical protein
MPSSDGVGEALALPDFMAAIQRIPAAYEPLFVGPR